MIFISLGRNFKNFESLQYFLFFFCSSLEGLRNAGEEKKERKRSSIESKLKVPAIIYRD